MNFGLQKKIKTKALDIWTDPFPLGDTFFFADIFHDWDRDKRSILAKKCYASLPSNGKIILHTNGSYRDPDWWTELASVMTKRDEILFSIDGTKDSFTKYRVNADIDSIYTAVKTIGKLDFKTRPRLIQKTILFKYVKWDIMKIIVEASEAKFDSILFHWPHVEVYPELKPDFDIEWVKTYLKKHKQYRFSYKNGGTEIKRDFKRVQRS